MWKKFEKCKYLICFFLFRFFGRLVLFFCTYFVACAVKILLFLLSIMLVGESLHHFLVFTSIFLSGSCWAVCQTYHSSKFLCILYQLPHFSSNWIFTSQNFLSPLRLFDGVFPSRPRHTDTNLSHFHIKFLTLLSEKFSYS